MRVTVAPMAAVDTIRPYLTPSGHYRLLALWVFNPRSQPVLYLDQVLVPLLSEFSGSVTIKEIHASQCMMSRPAHNGGYEPQTAYLIHKVETLKLCNPYNLDVLMHSGALQGSILESLICMTAFTDDPVIKALSDYCPKLKHVCFHAQADNDDRRVAAAEHPAEIPQLLSRERRKAARQNTTFCLEYLSPEGLKLLRTISIRNGLRSEVSDQQLLHLSEQFPDLTALGLPCPVITGAVEMGALDDDVQEDIEEQAVSSASSRIFFRFGFANKAA
jgi:hypothetical protein